MRSKRDNGYILFYLNNFQIPWYGHLAARLSDRTGMESILWVRSKEEYEFATRLGQFTEVANLFQGFEGHAAVSDYHRNLEILTQFEKQYAGVAYNNDVAIDRSIRNRQWAPELTAAFAVHLIRKMSRELRNYGLPHLAIGENNNLPFRLAHHILRSTPYIIHTTSRHWKDRFYWNEDQTYQWPDCVQLYNEYVKNGLPNYIHEEASRILESVRSKGFQPFYMKNHSNRKMIKPGSYGAYRQNWVTGAPAKLAKSVIKRIRSRYINRVALQSFSESTKFATLFLHHEPEYVVDGAAFPFRDQPNVIENVASYLPANIVLLVKEHKPSVGHRKLEYYRRIEGIPNVRLMSPECSSHDLIKKSEIVFTLSGTVALEAMYSGIPAIIFGDMFFQHFKGIHRVKSFEELGRMVVQVLENNDVVTDLHRHAAIGAMYSASHSGKIGPYFGIDEISEPENVDRIINSMYSLLKNQENSVPELLS